MSRFSEPQDPKFQELNASLSFDRRLWRETFRQERAADERHAWPFSFVTLVRR